MGEIKKEKKDNKILVIILLIALLAMSGYVVYDKIFSDKTTNETNSKEEVKEDEETPKEEAPEVEVLEVTSEEVKKLMGKIGALNACEQNRYYLDKKVVASDIDNSEAYNRAILLLYNEGVKMQNPGDIITEEQLNNAIARLYGKDYKFTHETRSGCPDFNYNQQEKKYELIANGCGGPICGPNTNKKGIVKAIKTDNKIEIYVRIIFVGTDASTKYPNAMNYYKDYKLTQPITNLNVDADGFATDSDENLQKGSLYKFIFTKVENDYAFTSSELVE